MDFEYGNTRWLLGPNDDEGDRYREHGVLFRIEANGSVNVTFNRSIGQTVRSGEASSVDCN